MTTPALSSAPPASAPAIACDLTVFSPTERVAHQHAFESMVCSLAREIVEHDDGFEFRFRDDAGPELVPQVSAWVVGERRCCPFFTFDLSMPPPGVGPVSLRLRGSLEAKAVMHAELVARSVDIRPASPHEKNSSAGQAVGSAGLVAGAGAMLCVLGCAAPTLAVGGAMASSLVVVAGYAEKIGTVLAMGGLLAGMSLALTRVARRRRVPAMECGCSAGSSGRRCS